MGGPEFFGVVKGGDQFFFSGSKGGPKFFEGHRGGDQNFFPRSEDGTLNFHAFGTISYLGQVTQIPTSG